MQALEFIDTCDPEELGEHIVALLFGASQLEERLRRFLEWSELRKGPDGSQVGFNATAVSYLLATSNPEMYAFCKPSNYKAAAEALLGKDSVVTNPIKRIVHATAFYQEALKLFRSEHGLPFTDLMHTHIAFYVVKQGFNGLPTWDTLRGQTESPKSEATVAADRNCLNTVLYGPPGTGKTYDSISRAVQICDGELPTDRAKIMSRYKALRAEGRIEFVTFHQSYGYEDFVEGIRPVLESSMEGASESEEREIRYECRDGVLKRICSLARTKETRRQIDNGVDPKRVPIWKMSLGNTLDPTEDMIYDECIENGYLLLGCGQGLDFAGCDSRQAVEDKLRSVEPDIKSTAFVITAVDTFKNKMQVGDLVVVSDGNRKFRAIGRIAGSYKRLERETYEQMRPVEWLVVFDESLPREKICKNEFSQVTIYRLHPAVLKLDVLAELLTGNTDSGERNHVLIIDEINRGNIAKILGELITLLEADKRIGAANEVQATLPYSGEPFGLPQESVCHWDDEYCRSLHRISGYGSAEKIRFH